MKKEKEKENEFGIYARCTICGQPIYEHMEENKEIFNDTEMCGACATGESEVYLNEM